MQKWTKETREEIAKDNRNYDLSITHARLSARTRTIWGSQPAIWTIWRDSKRSKYCRVERESNNLSTLQHQTQLWWRLEKLRPPHLIPYSLSWTEPFIQSSSSCTALHCTAQLQQVWPLPKSSTSAQHIPNRKRGPPSPHLSLWRRSHHPDPDLEPPPTHFPWRICSPCSRGRLRRPGFRCCWRVLTHAAARDGPQHTDVAGPKSVTAAGGRMGESRAEHSSLGNRQWAITRGEPSNEWQCLVGECERTVGEGKQVSELSEYESRLFWEVWTEIEHEFTFCA